MVVQGIHIEHVTLKLRLPLYCYKCRRPGMSEVLTVALGHVAPKWARADDSHVARWYAFSAGIEANHLRREPDCLRLPQPALRRPPAGGLVSGICLSAPSVWC